MQGGGHDNSSRVGVSVARLESNMTVGDSSRMVETTSRESYRRRYQGMVVRRSCIQRTNNEYNNERDDQRLRDVPNAFGVFTVCPCEILEHTFMVCVEQEMPLV